jgi:hypothetical protein
MSQRTGLDFVCSRTSLGRRVPSEGGTPSSTYSFGPLCSICIDMVASNAHQPADRLRCSALPSECSGRERTAIQSFRVQHFLTPPKFWTSGGLRVSDLSTFPTGWAGFSSHIMLSAPWNETTLLSREDVWKSLHGDITNTVLCAASPPARAATTYYSVTIEGTSSNVCWCDPPLTPLLGLAGSLSMTTVHKVRTIAFVVH